MYLSETQQQIIDYLSKNRLAGCRELSEVLGTSRANIHHHLSILRTHELIEQGGASSRTNASRGRPWRLYRLAGRYSLNNFEELANITLNLIKFSDTIKPTEITIQLAKSLCANHQSSPNLSRRLMDAVEFLNRRNYQAHWEAARTGPRVIFSNCPYAAIVDQNPELCQMDLIILTILTGFDYQQSTQMSQTDNSCPACVFNIFNE
jgi:predicted ArsR family transcriptional regulator